jgi:hypothetical protein
MPPAQPPQSFDFPPIPEPPQMGNPPQQEKKKSNFLGIRFTK